MYEMTIKGASLSEFYTNAVNLTVLLARGGQTVMTPQTTSPAPEANTVEQAQAAPVQESVAEPLANPSPTQPEAAPKRRGRPPKQTIEATATEVVETKDDGGIPEFLQRAGKPAEPPAELTLDGNIRPRIREINTAQTERAKEAGANDSDAAIGSVEYIKKLFAEFSIAKAADLPAAKYAEFMARSQAYLDGSAK